MRSMMTREQTPYQLPEPYPGPPARERCRRWPGWAVVLAVCAAPVVIPLALCGALLLAGLFLGVLAVTAGLENYKGGVTVYDDHLEPLFLYRASERFVIDACVTEDNRQMAAVTLGQENSVFVSSIVLYELGKEEPSATYDVSDGLEAAIGQLGDYLVTVSDTCFTAAPLSGQVEATYPYNGTYLREFDLGGEDFAALLLNRYKSGSVGRLVTVDPEGQEIASLDVNQEILSISAAGNYLAVLYMDSLVIYTRELEVYAVQEGTDAAREVLMRDDGSALLLASESAWLFLP